MSRTSWTLWFKHLYGFPPERGCSVIDIRWGCAFILAKSYHRGHETAAHAITGLCWNSKRPEDIERLRSTAAEILEVMKTADTEDKFRAAMTGRFTEEDPDDCFE